MVKKTQKKTKKKSQQKSAHIHIRSDAALKKLIGLAAKKSGKKESEWIRMWLEWAASTELG